MLYSGSETVVGKVRAAVSVSSSLLWRAEGQGVRAFILLLASCVFGGFSRDCGGLQIPVCGISAPGFPVSSFSWAWTRALLCPSSSHPLLTVWSVPENLSSLSRRTGALYLAALTIALVVTALLSRSQVVPLPAFWGSCGQSGAPSFVASAPVSFLPPVLLLNNLSLFSELPDL